MNFFADKTIRLKTELYAMLGDRAYWSVLFAIGIPVALQNLFSSGLNLIDSVMVGRLGDSSIAAVGIANTVFFLMILLLHLNCMLSLMPKEYGPVLQFL